MLMHVCPTGHAGLILIHSLMSVAGKMENRGYTWRASPNATSRSPQKPHVPPLGKTTNRCYGALTLDHVAASQRAPRFRQHTPP